MQFDEIVKKRLRGMAVRILATIEHTLCVNFSDMDNNEQFTLTGAELSIIRSEILNAAGDTTRSLSSLGGVAKPNGKISLSRELIAALNIADVNIIETPSDEEDIPIFRISGDFNLLNKIRTAVGAGVVYNKIYTCAGMDNVVDALIPFLDSTQVAGIKIAEGDYRGWRDAVCEIYLEGLGNE